MHGRNRFSVSELSELCLVSDEGREYCDARSGADFC